MVDKNEGHPLPDKDPAHRFETSPAVPPPLESDDRAARISERDKETLVRSIADAAACDDLANSKPRGKEDNGHHFPEIEGFQILRKLGQGGMGSVYLATDINLKRLVAIKIITHNVASKPNARTRFESEITTLASLHHPHIAQLYTAGNLQQQPYFVMEYVDGTTLEDVAVEPYTSNDAAQAVLPICDAVAYCHEQGVLHRDLKPSNVLLSKDQVPKIADFGLAKASGQESSSTLTGEILGTPGYMAPEQASGVVKQLTTACDVYAIGAIIYRLLTGRPPFVSPEPLQTVMMVLSDDPVPPSQLVRGVSRDLETICLKCLEKNPHRRYRSVLDLKADLDRFLHGRPILARRATPIERAVKWVRRNPTWSVIGAVTVIGIAAAIIGLVFHSSALTNQLNRTRRIADQGSNLSDWLLREHLHALNSIGGTAEARRAAAERIREYLDASYADLPPDPRYTRLLGEAYCRLATINGISDQNNFADLATAEKHLKRGIALLDQTLQADGGENSTKRLKTNALIDLAELYREQNRADESRQALKLARQLLSQITDDDWQNALLRCFLNGFAIEQALAENDLERAHDLLNQHEAEIFAIERTPVADTRRLAELENQRIWYAKTLQDCLSRMGRYADALGPAETAVKLSRESLKREPRNQLRARRLATALVGLADVQLMLGELEAALANYMQAEQLVANLRALDPAIPELAMDHARKLGRVARTMSILGRTEEARKTIEEAISIHQILAEREKHGVSVRRALAIYLLLKAKLCDDQGDIVEARLCYRNHERLCQELLDESPNSIDELNQLAESCYQQATSRILLCTSIQIPPARLRDLSLYHDALRLLDQSLAYFRRITAISPLTQQQQNVRDSVADLRTFLIQLGQQNDNS